MSKGPKRIQFEEFALNPETLFEAMVAEREPLLVEKEGLTFRIEITEEPEDIWADYDPQRAQAALKRRAGALSGIDHEQLIADIHAAREQDSSGRRA